MTESYETAVCQGCIEEVWASQIVQTIPVCSTLKVCQDCDRELKVEIADAVLKDGFDAGMDKVREIHGRFCKHDHKDGEGY